MLFYLQMLETEEDQSKFTQLYEYYQNMMFGVAMNILKNHFDAEDAVQQAFEAIIKNFQNVSEVQCPETKGLLVIITERKAIDIIRKNSKFVDADIDEILNAKGIDIPMIEEAPLANAMAKLSARYREVLLLKYHYGYEVKEIAKFFGEKPDTTQKAIWRAKKALQELLPEDMKNEE